MLSNAIIFSLHPLGFARLSAQLSFNTDVCHVVFVFDWLLQNTLNVSFSSDIVVSLPLCSDSVISSLVLPTSLSNWLFTSPLITTIVYTENVFAERSSSTEFVKLCFEDEVADFAGDLINTVEFLECLLHRKDPNILLVGVAKLFSLCGLCCSIVSIRPVQHQEDQIFPVMHAEHAAKLPIQALIKSHTDYSNSLLSSLPACTIKPLQLIQNATARLVFNQTKQDVTLCSDCFTAFQLLPV